MTIINCRLPLVLLHRTGWFHPLPFSGDRGRHILLTPKESGKEEEEADNPTYFRSRSPLPPKKKKLRKLSLVSPLLALRLLFLCPLQRMRANLSPATETITAATATGSRQ